MPNILNGESFTITYRIMGDVKPPSVSVISAHGPRKVGDDWQMLVNLRWARSANASASDIELVRRIVATNHEAGRITADQIVITDIGRLS